MAGCKFCEFRVAWVEPVQYLFSWSPTAITSSRRLSHFIVVNLLNSLSRVSLWLPRALISLQLPQEHDEWTQHRCTRQTQWINFYHVLRSQGFLWTGTPWAMVASWTAVHLHAHEVQHQWRYQVHPSYNDASNKQGISSHKFIGAKHYWRRF